MTCRQGHTHWGKHGAAGLLIRTPTPHRSVLLQLRVSWSHHGDTWGVLGGARDSDESVVQTALREAAEEAGVLPRSVRVTAAAPDDHGGWSYTTVLADAIEPFDAAPANAETTEVRWVREAEVGELPLHPGFAASWPRLRALSRPPLLVVDAANVVGSRPDGWWRDRLGAARRLRDRLGDLAVRGVPAGRLPVAPHNEVASWFPEIVLVVEGAARPLAGEPDPAGVHTVAAQGSGDDEVVRQLHPPAGEGRRTIVVTADRGLRARCIATDPAAVVVGPGWLHDLIG